jgi:hypothetical protein
MKIYFGRTLSRRFRRVAIAIAASGVAATGSLANPSDTIVPAPPIDLPELCRRSGEEVFLHETIDGRTLPYIEQIHVAGLATFDVSDPAHTVPKLKALPGFTLQSPITPLGNDEITVTPDYQVIGSSNLLELNRVFDVKQQ